MTNLDGSKVDELNLLKGYTFDPCVTEEWLETAI